MDRSNGHVNFGPESHLLHGASSGDSRNSRVDIEGRRKEYVGTLAGNYQNSQSDHMVVHPEQRDIVYTAPYIIPTYNGNLSAYGNGNCPDIARRLPQFPEENYPPKNWYHTLH